MEKNKLLEEIRTEKREKTMSDIGFDRMYYPRVSEIIGKQTQEAFDAIDPTVLENACIRGTKVHEYCTAYARGYWLPCLEEAYIPYVNAFTQWYDSNVEQTLFSSMRLYHDDLRYTGEFDMIVVLKDSKKIALLDLKTSATPAKYWPIQLAAYKHLCEINNYRVEAIFNIHLKKTKTKKGDQVKVIDTQYPTLENEWQIFSAALRCYDFFHRKEVKSVSE